MAISVCRYGEPFRGAGAGNSAADQGQDPGPSMRLDSFPIIACNGENVRRPSIAVV